MKLKKRNTEKYIEEKGWKFTGLIVFKKISRNCLSLEMMVCLCSYLKPFYSLSFSSKQFLPPTKIAWNRSEVRTSSSLIETSPVHNFRIAKTEAYTTKWLKKDSGQGWKWRKFLTKFLTVNIIFLVIGSENQSNLVNMSKSCYLRVFRMSLVE